MMLLLAFALGFVCGLRTFAPLAIFSGAALIGAVRLSGTGFSFLGEAWVFAVLAALALFELGGDKAKSAPPRTSVLALSGRILAGAILGGVVGALAGMTLTGAVFGALGAFVGAYAGKWARGRLRRPLGGNANAGMAEDLIVGVAALGLVSAL